MLKRLLLLLVVSVGIATPSPLTLQYTKAQVEPGLWEYSFMAELTNGNAMWHPGQQFAMFTFGDNPNVWPYDGFGDLPGFTLTSPAPHPWTGVGGSWGVVMGPTFYDPALGWRPENIGDRIYWSGTSTNEVPAGALCYSVMWVHWEDEWGFSQFYRIEKALAMEVASLPAPVPEPANFALIGVPFMLFVLRSLLLSLGRT